MKEFKLFDKEWLQQHISVSIVGKDRKVYGHGIPISFTSKDYYWLVDFKNMYLVDTYSEITGKEFPKEYYREISKKYTKMVFRDNSDGEYYIFDLRDEDVAKLYADTKYPRSKDITQAILTHIVKMFDIKPDRDIYIERDIRVNLTSLEYDIEDSRSVIEKWLFDTLKIDKTLLTDVSLSNVVDHCKNLSTPKIKARKTQLIEDAIKGEVSNKDLDNYIAGKNAFIVDCLNKNKGSIYIKYILFRNDISFSGHYKVSFLNEKKYKNKPRTFDAIALDIGVLGGVEHAKESIIKHKEEVLKVIATIMRTDKATKPYAKFMKLTKMKILTDGCLYVQFDFKDGLREAIMSGLDFGE